ncbi:AraC family transcriptional regulator [Desulfoscipio sp. XC116]|uniref:helix-turn-helix transcriptional regulator n=1 Tax=Desulfoscipio sp. XC116 TaxID=3144975 RepID=UPI00325A9935
MNKTGFCPDWYGKGVKLLKQHFGCSVISYQCNGTGMLHDYALFPGINLIFMDFNCADTFDEPSEVRNILELRHYQEGRIEFEFDGQKVFHLQQDEFCINALMNMPARYSFPFEYCTGLSLIIDRDALTDETISQLAPYQIDLSALEYDLDLERQWYICKTPSTMLHIFNELYAAKGNEPVEYFRIKALELLYHAGKLWKGDRVAATYYSREHIDIVKRVRRIMLDDLSSNIPLEKMLRGEHISTVTFQAIFKQIYGRSPYAYLKRYKMNSAAVQLCESSESINQIALSLGYSNASKFARAFQDVFRILPRAYRSQKKSI